MNHLPNRAEEIVDGALDVTPEQRAAYLAKECGEDAELRQLVESLLQAHRKAPPLRQHPAGSSLKPTSPVSIPLAEKLGDGIGRYKLLQQVGEGGCGVVYMAEQEEPVRRRVALKIIKLGMDTRQVIARFEAERQALAMMDHPNIAKVLDAGATDAGRPYFVMELVRGIRITDYCDQTNLPTAKRLDLFVQVCRAIQHAHQKGIIHRDIKPPNILVTLHDGVPVPKVIDFGIAKATEQRLTDKTLFTALEQLIGTPAYMSPEQAEMSGLDIDTRSDIYSLGVLLYELLTGKVPFEAKELAVAGLEEMRRIIREKDPVRPSTRISSLDAPEQTTIARRRHVEAPKLIHQVRGDLDWIVMKCLEKDRTRRYETTNALARDIQRHLDGELVAACPPSNLYRFQKLVRRNKLAFAAAGTVTVVLVLGLGFSIWSLTKERTARQEATKESAKSKQVAQFLESMLKGVGPSYARGRDVAMLREILDQTAERVGKELKGQPEVEAELRQVIGKTYYDLGLITNALDMGQEALRVLRMVHGQEHPAVARALTQLGAFLWGANQYAASERVGREALEMKLRLMDKQSTNVATSYDELALALWAQGKLTEAETAEHRALWIRTNVWGIKHEAVARSLNNLGGILWDKGQFGVAEPKIQEAVGLFRELLPSADPLVASAVGNLGLVLLKKGDLEAAKANYTEALEIRKKVFGPDHPNIAYSLTQLALALADDGELDEAEVKLREALDMQRRLRLGDKPDVADSLAGLGLVLGKKGDLAQAESNLQEALAMRRRLHETESPEIADLLDGLAILRATVGQLATARTMLQEALSKDLRSLGEGHPNLIAPRSHLAWVLGQEGNLSSSNSLRSKIETATRQHGLYGVRAWIESTYDLADLLQIQGKFTAAEPLLLEAVEYLHRSSKEGVFLRRRGLERLVGLYEAWDKTESNTGKSGRAADWRKELEALNQAGR